MIIVDRALSARAVTGDPIRVGVVGAGFMGRGIVNQIVNAVPGMTVAAIANRTGAQARRAYEEAGVDTYEEAGSTGAIEAAVAAGTPVITEDAVALARTTTLDAIIEATGTIEFAAEVVVAAIEAGLHVALVNAELDGTLGPILKAYADRAGVVLTAADGDQPGVQMNLYRFVRGIGITPLLCGNIKGLHDPYRTPTTQRAFAERWGQRPAMVTSFADGTKISFEQAVVANGTGMRVAQRGMLGHHLDDHIDAVTELFDVDDLRASGGLVDYVVGARPAPGVYVLGTIEDPKQRHYLEVYKLGEGPLYTFYRPYHLCHFEAPWSVARAVLFGDATLAPLAGPMVDVVAAAKQDLASGTILDGLGGYDTYGLAENHDVVRTQRLVPMGLAEGCRLRRDVERDTVLTYDDIERPTGRLADQLRAEQDRRFPATPPPADAS